MRRKGQETHRSSHVLGIIEEEISDQITYKNNEKHFTLFLCQHKDSFDLVHCNSNLPAVVQGDACDTVQYPEKINTEYLCVTHCNPEEINTEYLYVTHCNPEKINTEYLCV